MSRQLGRRIFVAVVDDRGFRRSTVWQFKVSGAEVYGGQGDMHQQKLSLHTSGLCMWAFEKPYWDHSAKHERPHRTSRVIDKWNRPATPLTGSAHAFSVGFPGACLGNPMPLLGVPADRLLALPCPAVGRAAEVAVHFSYEDPEVVSRNAPESFKFAAAPLGTGEFVYFLALESEFDDTLIRKFVDAPKVVEWRDATTSRDDVMQNASASWHLGADANHCFRVLEMGGLTVAPGTRE
jgi:hypothetical protein